MPRALDAYQIQPTHDPNRSGTEFHLAGFQDIDKIIADIINGAIETFKTFIIPAIKDLTGIDLATWGAFIEGLFEQTGVNLANLAETFIGSLESIIFGVPNTRFTLTFPHRFALPPNPVSDFFKFVGEAPQQIIDAIVNAFRSIPIVGPGIADLIDTVLAMVGFSDDAQQTATTASGEIAAIKAGLAGAGVGGGASIVDDFDRSTATTLGSSWTQIYAGPGAGTEGTDGTGNCHWSPSGSNARTVVNRHNTALTTTTQYASFVLREQVGAHFTAAASRSLMLRSNPASTSYVLAYVGRSAAQLAAVVSGTPTTLATVSGLTLKPGDFWEFQAGTAAAPYRYILKVNGVTVIDYTDTAHVSVVSATPGTGTLWTGFGGQAGDYLTSPITFAQLRPPDVAAFGAADITG